METVGHVCLRGSIVIKNEKIGHLKTDGGVSMFQKCLNYKVTLRPHPKKRKIKTLNLALFNVNMPKRAFKMLVWGVFRH